MVEKSSARPPRLVTTCIYLVLAGSFHVISSIVVLTGWYTSGEEQVKRYTDPLVREGFSRADAETTYRVYLAILAMLAGSVVVFAIYTALGHAASRILVTIAAPLMAMVGLVQASFFSIVLSFVAFMAVFQLWTPEVRRWFMLLSGKEPPPQPVVPATPGAQQQTGQWQGHPQAYAQGYSPQPPVRRDPVKVIALIALIGSAVVAMGSVVYLVMYEFAREELVRQQLESSMNWMDLTETEIRDSMADLAVLSWAALVLCVVAAVVSTLLLVRRRRRS